jgi:hypothetical protein
MNLNLKYVLVSVILWGMLGAVLAWGGLVITEKPWQLISVFVVVMSIGIYEYYRGFRAGVEDLHQMLRKQFLEKE